MTTFSATVYNERAPARYPKNLSQAAEDLGVSIQRLRRYVRILEIPVTRQGYAVMLDAGSYRRVKKALSRNEVKRGRKKKAS